LMHRSSFLLFGFLWKLFKNTIKERLFVAGEGLSLDSIDALELGVALKKKFGISFSQDEEDNKKHFYSVATLSDFISKNAV